MIIDFSNVETCISSIIETVDTSILHNCAVKVGSFNFHGELTNLLNGSADFIIGRHNGVIYNYECGGEGPYTDHLTHQNPALPPEHHYHCQTDNTGYPSSDVGGSYLRRAGQRQDHTICRILSHRGFGGRDIFRSSMDYQQICMLQTGGVLLFLLAAGDVGGQLEEGHPVPAHRYPCVPGGHEDRPGDSQWISADCVWTVVHLKDVQGGHCIHSDRDTVHPNDHTRHKSGHPRDLHTDRQPAILPTDEQPLMSHTARPV